MQVRVLGPVGVGCPPTAAGSPKQQILLAALALDLNRAVPVEILVERLWGGNPPPAARSSLYAYVTRIRRLLAATADSRPPIRLCRLGCGYALEADPETVDIHRVRELARRARETGGGPEALTLLREALGCWRGEPLAGLSGDWVERVREGLDRERLDLLIARFDLELRSGRPEPVIGELSAAVAAHPLAEPLVGQLMVALYRSGRVSEALACFADARRRIREHLGVEPGRELRDLHQRMLRDDPDVGVDNPAPPRTLAVATTATAPAQLPPDVATFVGRRRELWTLDAMSTTGPAPVIVITGPAGVGKTALAVHWAHRAAARFDHGQLYVDMLGYHERAPMAPAVALARCLRALGVTTIPSDIDELTGAFRTLVRGRRLLLVLDNVRSAEQVRPLLPAGPGCCVVVTSRRRLDGLVARDGAQTLALKALDADDACALLGQLIGVRRVSAEPGAARRLVERCDRLPLVIRIAAAKLAASPERSLASAVAELADERMRLAALEVPDDVGVRAALALTYRTLPDRTALLFRRIVEHPGPDLCVRAAAALVGGHPATAARTLEDLDRLHLVHPTAPGRYALRGLVRLFAAERAAEDRIAARRAARRRLIEYYLTAVTGGRGQPSPDEEALAWVHAERDNLLAVVGLAASEGRHDTIRRFTDRLAGICARSAHRCPRLSRLRRALDAALAGDTGYGPPPAWRLGLSAVPGCRPAG